MGQTLSSSTLNRDLSADYRSYVNPCNPQWRRRRNAALALTLGRDVLFPWLKAQHVDHLSYAKMGAELPIRDIVPLHRTTHAVVTALRARGYKTSVDAILRAAALAWLLIPIATVTAYLLTR